MLVSSASFLVLFFFLIFLSYLPNFSIVRIVSVFFVMEGLDDY